ncbi:MAG TPA: hypothetical protein VLJ16_08165 [Acidobacteriota bacterium]|nr:hypothetical protein [Acidobacteriota bacterium]
MKVIKRSLLFVAVLGLAASLGAQSLAELSKKEKARREALKGRHAATITNVDLLRVRKTSAVEVAPAEAGQSEVVEGEETVAGDQGETGSLPSGSGAPSSARMVPQIGPNGPLITGGADRDQAEGAGTLDVQLKAAKEMVDLLTTKMNALRQQFEAQDAMVPGYVIQQQLDETNQRLLKAQAQQARIEAQIVKRAGAKKPQAEVER